MQRAYVPYLLAAAVVVVYSDAVAGEFVMNCPS